MRTHSRQLSKIIISFSALCLEVTVSLNLLWDNSSPKVTFLDKNIQGEKHSFCSRPLRGEPCGDTVGLEWREEMVETVSSDGLLALQSSDEFTGGFFTTWGELESGDEKKR